MKTTVLFILFLASLLNSMVPARARDVRTHYPETVKSNLVNVVLIPDGEIPEWMAVVVQADTIPQSSDNRLFDNPKWLPFNTNMVVDLGPGDGRREMMFSFRYRGQSHGDSWGGGGLVVRTLMPDIGIISPKEHVTSRPVAQLSCYFSSDANQIKYDVYDQNGLLTVNKENGLVHDTYYDQNLAQTTTNYFNCVDVPLSPGTNTVVIHCEDRIGNVVNTNFVIVFTTVGATNPPVITPKYPMPGMVIGSDSFIVMGLLDDPTAHLTGQLSANGHTQDITFRVGRTGDYYSVSGVPVTTGANQLTLTATDAAGNTSITNMVVYGGDARITMDPFDPLHPVGPWITLTGKVSPANYDVWVGGVKAKVKPDGTWRAEKVPDNRTPGGGWVFDLAATPPSGLTNVTSKLSQALSAQASLSTNAMILNAFSPACGIFQLHLTETTGHRFILETSTNLNLWLPILTNSNPDATFDYTDTNANNIPCRFFRVVPLP